MTSEIFAASIAEVLQANALLEIRLASLHEKYEDLLLQVDMVVPGETRHETARRILAYRNEFVMAQAKASTPAAIPKSSAQQTPPLARPSRAR